MLDINYFVDNYAVPDREILNGNPNLIELYIPKSHQDWHEFRKQGIGASEVGVVVGVNMYNLLPKLVEEKVGTKDPYKAMNEAMISGLLAEPALLKRWMHHDGTELGYVENITQEKIIRTAQPVHSYIVNVNYPYLFVSLDARVEANQQHLSGAIVPYEFPLELKTIRAWEAQKWADGVPAMYRFQIQTQMLVTETDYAELAVLEDGVSFKVIPFKKDEEMQELIIQKSLETYHLINRLREMRKEIDYYLSEGQGQKANQLQALYESELPLPHDEEIAKEYYSEKMAIDHPEFIATDEDLVLVRERVKISESIKILDKEKQLLENLIMRKFSLEKCEYMKLGVEGRVRYYRQENRKNFQLDFRSAKIPAPENLKTKIQLILK
jgi:putative phage-type endonuclease